MNTSYRILYGVLFVCGIFFALFCWIFAMLPLGIFSPKYKYTILDTIVSLGISSLALSGYFVWANWFSVSIWEKCQFISKSALHGLSLANHTGWALILPVAFREYPWDYFTAHPVLALWLFINIAFAVQELLLGGPSVDHFGHNANTTTP